MWRRTETSATDNQLLPSFRLPLPAICIVTRTESNRTANAIRSDGGRNLIGRRTQSDRAADANGDKSITYTHAKFNRLRGCTCLKCTKSITYTHTKLSF